jgi:hypothetical protein
VSWGSSVSIVTSNWLHDQGFDSGLDRRLPLSIKAHSNDAKRFKTTLKNYLIEHAFYSLDEYYQFQRLWFFLFILFILFMYISYFN